MNEIDKAELQQILMKSYMKHQELVQNIDNRSANELYDDLFEIINILNDGFCICSGATATSEKV